MITVSIVSHGHCSMVQGLVRVLLSYEQVQQIIVTQNIPAPLVLPDSNRIQRIDNPHPQGFGENHNAAFARCNQPYFCVLNPDIMLSSNPFPPLLEHMHAFEASLVAPVSLSPDGGVEDSLRRFPTMGSLLSKAFGGDDGRYHVAQDDPPLYTDWVGGMFMLFRSDAFSAIGGFDESFHLYYEDVDICARLWKAAKRIVSCPDVAVVHDARRTSRRNLVFMRWHLVSMVRYFWKHMGRLPAVPYG